MILVDNKTSKIDQIKMRVENWKITRFNKTEYDLDVVEMAIANKKEQIKDLCRFEITFQYLNMDYIYHVYPINYDNVRKLKFKDPDSFRILKSIDLSFPETFNQIVQDFDFLLNT